LGAPFTHRLRVRYAECDPQGVVFNAHYVTYFDTAITELWRAALGSYQAMLDAGTDMMVAELGIRYRAPARFDDELELGLVITRLGTTSISTAFSVRRAGEEPLLAEGQLRHVFIDPESGRKKAIPESVRAALEPYAQGA
jgi:acyl-CoA thioester hydrolase